MLKVGDKVKVKEDLVRGQRRGSHYYYFIAEAMCKYRGEIVTISKINVNEQYLLIEEDDNRWKWTEDMFDKIEEDKNMKGLTFKEVIANIKEGEVWESDVSYISKRKGVVDIWDNKPSKTVKSILDDALFILQRKQYSFEEAFKSFEKGREIESCESKLKYKIYEDEFIRITNSTDDKKWLRGNDDRNFTVSEIQNKWYIND